MPADVDARGYARRRAKQLGIAPPDWAARRYRQHPPIAVVKKAPEPRDTIPADLFRPPTEALYSVLPPDLKQRVATVLNDDSGRFPASHVRLIMNAATTSAWRLTGTTAVAIFFQVIIDGSADPLVRVDRVFADLLADD